MPSRERPAAIIRRLLYRLRPWGWRFYHSGYGYADGRAWTKKGAQRAWTDAAIDLGYMGEGNRGT